MSDLALAEYLIERQISPYEISELNTSVLDRTNISFSIVYDLPNIRQRVDMRLFRVHFCKIHLRKHITPRFYLIFGPTALVGSLTFLFHQLLKFNDDFVD